MLPQNYVCFFNKISRVKNWNDSYAIKHSDEKTANGNLVLHCCTVTL